MTVTSITFSIDENYILPASILSGANFSIYRQFSRTVFSDRVAWLKDFCTVSTKKLLTQCLLHKYKSKA